MYWKLSTERADDGVRASGAETHGRFVLHRHHDAGGPHLDLRFEQDGYLSGFRIDGLAIADGVWASEKGAHPIDWLERDGDAVREDSGTYHRRMVNDNEMCITLHGGQGDRVLRAVREPGLTPSAVRDVCAALGAYDAVAADAARLIADGVTARRRAIDRMCGLARELDGGAFDEDVCRRALAPLALEDIHAQLRGYESRFDAKYPPLPVSRPEPMSEQRDERRCGDAMAIVRGDGSDSAMARRAPRPIFLKMGQ